MPFKKGQSGNPKGRPKGALNKASMAAQQLLDGEAQEITRKVIELAKKGNPMALKLCLERVLPPRKDRPVSLKLPEVKEATDVPRALNGILAAVSQGDITPNEAGILAGLVGAAHKAITSLPPKPDENEIFLEDFDAREVRLLYLKLMSEIRRVRKERNILPRPQIDPERD
jgi:hypothetical protein